VPPEIPERSEGKAEAGNSRARSRAKESIAPAALDPQRSFFHKCGKLLLKAVKEFDGFWGPRNSREISRAMRRAGSDRSLRASPAEAETDYAPLPPPYELRDDAAPARVHVTDHVSDRNRTGR